MPAHLLLPPFPSRRAQRQTPFLLRGEQKSVLSFLLMMGGRPKGGGERLPYFTSTHPHIILNCPSHIALCESVRQEHPFLPIFISQNDLISLPLYRALFSPNFKTFLSSCITDAYATQVFSLLYLSTLSCRGREMLPFHGFGLYLQI
mmetsp:Transcript_29058/g.74630  ORF Transcript_29058/g.74630 Transcript_29058/m.74630 type:complete len:147 (-) Transcript_29058:78-518(-)